MTSLEIKFLLGALVTLLSLLAYIGRMAVDALRDISKDINEMVLSGLTKQQLISIIKENTYSGLRAEMELNNWHKI
jgi:hypothetical protein